jgi:hypothetical protein
MNIKSRREWGKCKTSRRMKNIIPTRNLGLESLFFLSIYILTICDKRKITWTINEAQRTCIGTCGYTGPGIAIILNLLIENNIKTYDQFINYINTYKIETKLINTINDTILNFLDLSNFCPITKVDRGIMGLAKETHEEKMQTEDTSVFYPIRFYRNGNYNLIGTTNLQEGVNLISFTDRNATVENLCTFHHSVIYIHNKSGTGYIIDSWATPQGVPFDSRPIEFRKYGLITLFKALYTITNSNDINESANFINFYFQAHTATLRPILYNIGITDPNKIKEVYAIAGKQHGLTGGARISTAFIKRNQTKKHKKIKKYKKMKSKKINIKR